MNLDEDWSAQESYDELESSVALEPCGDLEALELELLLTAVANRYGYDYRNYSPAFLLRRVRRMLRLEQVESLSALQERILRDTELFERFALTLSIHYTRMFRNAQFFKMLREKVIPMLATWPFVRLWHAGCSSGEEVYSMAILLQEAGLLQRCRIYATDINGEALTQARNGIFSLSEMREFTRAYYASGGTADFSSYYIADHGHAIFRDDLRRHIVFSQHNLVQDKMFNEFHMIFCRNVLIFFNENLREQVRQMVYDSLVRFGFLVLGRKESLRFASVAKHFEVMDEDLSLYRKVS